MYKDIVIDNMIAKNFCNPVSPDYKKLIKWLQVEGSLAVCQHIINEYISSTGTSPSLTNICIILNTQLKDGRLNKISKKKLDAFIIKKSQLRNIKSHSKDIKIVKTVLLSDRKMLLTKEDEIVEDLRNYPGYSCKCGKHPTEFNYM